jgi:hypothetical protein
MTLVLECRADQALAQAVGIPHRHIRHSLGRGRVCKQLAELKEATGMMDDDPGVTKPSYFDCLTFSTESHGVRLLIDKERGNRIVILSPRLEEWLVQSVKVSGLKMTEYGFDNDNGLRLHAEINQRLANVERLVNKLLSARNARILCLQALIKPV